MVLGDLDRYMQKKKRKSISIHKYKFKVDKRLKCKLYTIKVLEENTGRKISDIPHRNILTDTSPKARDIKGRINKWDLVKIKSFCMATENSSKI